MPILTRQLDLSPTLIDSLLTDYVARVGTASLPTADNDAVFSTDTGGGVDVWFSSDEAGAVPIDARLLYWSDANSAFAFDVVIASVSSVTGATIYLHVGLKPSGYSTDPYQASDVALYPLVEGGTDVISAFDGTATGGVTAGGVTGPDGSLPATAFNGSTDCYLIDETGEDFLPLGDATVQAWVKLPASPTSINTIFELGGATHGLHLLANSSLQVVGVQIANTTAYASSAQLTSGQWYHVAYCVDLDGSNHIFVDGVLQDTDAPAPSASTWGSNASGIGRVNGSSLNGAGSVGSDTWHFEGELSQVSIHSRAMTAAEFKANAALQGPSAAAHWTVTTIDVVLSDVYVVYSRTSTTSSSTRVAILDSNTLSYTLTGLTANSEQYYYVNYISACGVESTVSPTSRMRRVAMDASNQLIPPAPNAPHAVRLELGPAGLVTAHWQHTNDNGEIDAASFHVYVATDADAFDFKTPTHTVSLPARSVGLGTFADNTTVRVVVRAVTAGSVEETNTNETTTTADAVAPPAPASITIV